MAKRELSRGSLWNQWDLHVHTPASFHWLGQKFGIDPASDQTQKLIDEMIRVMNSAAPAVFAIMDYWTFDGWHLLQKRLKEKGVPELKKTVFPGIELRLAAPMKGRLNAHVLFSNEIQEQSLLDFKSALRVEVINRPLSNPALMELARAVGDDKLKVHGFNSVEVATSDEKALLAGSVIAEINPDSYRDAISNVPHGHAIGFMPWDTSDGLAEVKWQEHYAYAMSLFQSSPIFETRDCDLHAAFVGERKPGNSKYFANFQSALKNVPRLAVSGSDAHCFVGVPGDNDKRGYGDYPSNKKTWIKADPSFRGLKQAILEPAKRSFIGDWPPKLQEVESNKTYYIDTIEISKSSNEPNVGQWLDGCDVSLNPDLVAIIGNKGSGKSALADVIASLGNSKRSDHFSFLRKDRFFGKKGTPARHFVGTLTWRDASTEARALNELPLAEKAELVRYIPQGYFENLCNEHVAGKSSAFQNELESVIFSHTSDEIRLGALDFDQLTEQQERSLRNRLAEYRKDLASINASIVRAEEQLQPLEIKKLTDLLLLKNKQIEEHEKLKPSEISPPAEELGTEQRLTADKLAAATKSTEELKQRVRANAAENTEMAKKQKAIANLQERLRLLQRAFDQAQQESVDDLNMLEIKWPDLACLSLTKGALDEKLAHIAARQIELKSEQSELDAELISLGISQKSLSANLNAPQQLYETHQSQLTHWTKKNAELIGTSTEPESKTGLETRINQIKGLPKQLDDLEATRLSLTGEIFETLDAQRTAREVFFRPVQDLIHANELIREDYKLQFQATLAASADAISELLFNLIKQNSSEFRGLDDAFSKIRNLTDTHDLNTKNGALAFVAELHKKVIDAAKSGDSTPVGIFSVIKKGQSAVSVYDLIFGLNFLEPRYSLLFQDTQIEQLSPGQRGALLLIFYLLVDKGKIPIILDQPEENLDNETVFRLLVPVLSEAKKKRQIIMVTHNPNLAVVCDAEQIIYAKFDRAANSSITYKSGSIENSTLNEAVVTVLEGTKPAFDNRSGKYH
jgi:ABC-type lipoprotein export system ATPase subunit/uncharacterized protein YfkK (UPF0435 family)/predicted metal-dependent phosphoesterase TrpH